MFATERSPQTLRLAGALLLVVAGRIYLSSGGAEAMVFTTPHLHQVEDVLKLLAFVALSVVVSAAVAAAGKRWVGRLACVGLGRCDRRKQRGRQNWSWCDLRVCRPQSCR